MKEVWKNFGVVIDPSLSFFFLLSSKIGTFSSESFDFGQEEGISFDIVGQNGFFAKIVSFSRGVDVTRATPFRFVKKVRRNFGGIPSSLFRTFRVSLLRGMSTIVEHDFRIQRGFYIYIYIFFATIAKALPSRAIRSARLDSDRRGFLEKNAKVPGFIRGINRSRKRCVRRSETEKVRAR